MLKEITFSPLILPHMYILEYFAHTAMHDGRQALLLAGKNLIETGGKPRNGGGGGGPAAEAVKKFHFECKHTNADGRKAGENSKGIAKRTTDDSSKTPAEVGLLSPIMHGEKRKISIHFLLNRRCYLFVLTVKRSEWKRRRRRRRNRPPSFYL